MSGTRRNLFCAQIRARAAAEVERAAPHLRAFWESLPLIPLHPAASQNSRTSTLAPWSGPLRLDEAITCPWIALNSRRRVNALCVDIDHPDGTEFVARLPVRCHRPTLVIDPWSGRSHAILPLATPVLTGAGAKTAPIGYARLAPSTSCGSPRRDAASPYDPREMPDGPGAEPHRTTAVSRQDDGHPVSVGCVYRGTGLMWITQLGNGPAELRGWSTRCSTITAMRLRPSAPGPTGRRGRANHQRLVGTAWCSIWCAGGPMTTSNEISSASWPRRFA